MKHKELDTSMALIISHSLIFVHLKKNVMSIFTWNVWACENRVFSNCFPLCATGETAHSSLKRSMKWQQGSRQSKKLKLWSEKYIFKSKTACSLSLQKENEINSTKNLRCIWYLYFISYKCTSCTVSLLSKYHFSCA